MKPPDEFLDFAVKMCGPQVVRVIEMWEEERLRIGELAHGTTARYASGCTCGICVGYQRDRQRKRLGLAVRLGADSLGIGGPSRAVRLGFDPEELAIRGLQLCPGHNGILPRSSFPRSSARASGRGSYCQHCMALTALRRRREGGAPLRALKAAQARARRKAMAS